VIRIREAVKSFRRSIPKLYASDSRDPFAWVRFFDRLSGWVWYVLEYDGDNTFFGYVEGIGAEFGYFSLSELEAFNKSFGV